MQPIQNLQTFRNGGLDQDDSPEYISQNDVISAWNCRNSGTHVSEAGNITNPESTTLIPGTRANGINKGIGGRAFEDVRQLVIFIYNSGGFHQLSVYDYDTDTQRIVYTDKTDSNGIPLLTLDPQYYVQCVLINGTYLVWTDGISEVGYTNLTTLTSGSYGTVLAEDLSLIKPQPLIPITGVYASDVGKASNFVKGHLYQFTPKWTGADFNSSTWGTWSKRIIPPQEATPTEGTDVTSNNCIIVSVNAGSIRATQLDVACRYGLFDFNIIKTVTRAYITSLPNTSVDIANQIFESYNPTTNIYSFVFYNQSLSIPVAPTETDQFVDYIWPATAIEKINGNIIAIGDLKVGYDRPTTSVSISASGYNPNLTIPNNGTRLLPLAVSVVYAGGEGSGSNRPRRRMQVKYTGVPITGDILNLTTNSASDATDLSNYTYTVPPSQDGSLFSVVLSFSAILSGAVTTDGSGYIITFYEDPRPHRRIQSASVILFATGATVSKSIHAVLDNSSYQLALEYRDKYGRPFPIQTDNKFIITTPSFAQLNGLTPKISWQINQALAPVGAYDYQWLITKNTTVINLLDVMGNLLNYKGTWDAKNNTPTLAVNTGTVGDTYQITTPNDQSDITHLVNLGNGNENFKTGDYVSYNGKSWDIIPKSFADLTSTSNVLAMKINPLNMFNERYANNGVNTILNYDFTPGDRCTLHYYFTPGSLAAKTYLNAPCIDVDIYGYDPTTFLVKIQKSSSINPATLLGKDIFLRLYTPNTQKADSAVTTDNTTVWYEIGERFTITGGNHDTLTGDITDGDVYFKTRSYNGGVDPNVVYDILATDFNFSDFYLSNFTSYGRPRSYYDILERTEQKATIITSQNYILGSKKNGLNRFYPESQYGESDGQTSSSYGAIQVLWQRGDMLEVFQELRLGSIPVNRSILEDAIQQQQYAISQKLLNNIRYSQTASVGIGLAKESFCFKDNNAYFVDPNRSEPFRYGVDGIQSISGKMSKYFKATIQLAYGQGKKLVMFYNMFYDEVMLCIQADGGVLTFFPFNSTSWQSFDPYVIVAGDITAVNNGSHSTAVNNGNGTATYTPTTNYVGNDVGTFSFNTAGGVITKNICLNWTDGTSAVDPFAFTPQINVNLSTLVVSNSILVNGINVTVPISISSGGAYSKNGGAYTSVAGTVVNGDNITVRQTSSATVNTATSVTLNINGTTGVFTVTTKHGATVNLIVNEQANPYADANGQVKFNGAVPTGGTINGTGTASFNIISGDSISIEAFSELLSTGGSPNLKLNSKKNTVNIFPDDNTPAIPGASIVHAGIIATDDAVYDFTVTSTASGAPGYSIVNNTGSTVTYNIYDGGGTLTSTSTLVNGAVLNIQTLITGGANSEIRFVAFATGTYNYTNAPSGTTGTAGMVTTGSNFADYTVANIATQVGLGLVGRIYTFLFP